MKHKLTVIMTSYNIAEYLPRFFFCMQRQTFTDFCILAVDDGSTDDSFKIIEEHAKKDDRIIPVASEHLGIAGIKNLALGMVDTPLVSFADGDDIIGPEYLEHLVNALEKYNADLAISRVEYLYESGQPYNVQTPYEERYINKTEFAAMLPPLLRDRRLNYFYAKVYRSALLKGVRIEDDVKQGGDTMLVFQYLVKINSIVLIDDVDYHYIKYTSRSITSYFGDEAFDRLLRINIFLLDFTKEHGILTNEMLHIIDGRILISGNWVIEKIMQSDASKSEKIRQLSHVLENKHYECSFERQKENLKKLRFDYIEPQKAERFYANYIREKKKLKTKMIILKNSPRFVLNMLSKKDRSKQQSK